MSLEAVILTELKNATKALQQAVSGVGTSVQGVGTHVDAVGTLLGTVSNAVASVAAAVDAVGAKVTAVQTGAMGIKSIQRGVAAVPYNTAGGNITITAVNPAKSELRLLGWSGGTTDASSGVHITLLNATTLAVWRTGANGSASFGWEITEWK